VVLSFWAKEFKGKQNEYFKWKKKKIDFMHLKNFKLLRQKEIQSKIVTL